MLLQPSHDTGMRWDKAHIRAPSDLDCDSRLLHSAPRRARGVPSVLRTAGRRAGDLLPWRKRPVICHSRKLLSLPPSAGVRLAPVLRASAVYVDRQSRWVRALLSPGETE